MPGFARAHCHGDGTPIRPGASGTKAAADVPPGVSRYPVSRLICGRASSAGSGSREPAWPACRTLAQWYGVNRDTLAGRRPGRPAARQLGGNSAKMNTLKCGRSSTTGPSPPVNSRYRPPARTFGRSISARRSGRPSRCRASTSASKSADQASTPIVWSLVIWRSWPPRIWNTREPPTQGRPGAVAGEQHHGQRCPRARRRGR